MGYVAAADILYTYGINGGYASADVYYNRDGQDSLYLIEFGLAKGSRSQACVYGTSEACVYIY